MKSFERELAVFSAARQLPAAERAAYLDQTCAGNPALRQRVEELLRAGEDAEGFLQEPAPGAQRPDGPPVAATLVLGAAAPGEKAGDRIGHYKLLQQIGEGGCGLVYMAEQEEPVRWRVALKVIKLGMDTKQVIARFEAERQALAMMDHPNIAKIYDAGATGGPLTPTRTEDETPLSPALSPLRGEREKSALPISAGRPYFVMELVRGIKITDYCDEHKLSTKDRLELFIQVCHAVQHAHQKGIIHRDLKPSNILVASNDGVPVPKVIDFGIAKATQGRLTDQTLFTAFEQFIGTPAYMSPEQAELTMRDVDTRTDIYSLGVLLYELLTGKTPFDAKELLASGLDAMRRTIREQNPERPSTKLSTLLEGELTTTAKHRRTEAAKLVHLLRGDLDWIVMKCLEKDRARRYETANGLANDVRRHLNCEPVVARPPSRLYEFQKTVRRHKFGFAAAGAVMVALAFGLGLSTWMFFKEAAAKQRAVSAEREQNRFRTQAEQQELAARRAAYAADMNLVEQSIANNQFDRVQALLNRHRPQPGQEDLRGWEWRCLWQYCHRDPVVTLVHAANPINALSCSADGKWLAIGEYVDGGLSVWDLAARRAKTRLPAGDSRVHAAFSPTQPLLAYSVLEGPQTNRQARVRLWDAVLERGIGEIALAAECHGLAFSADGLTLATSTASPDDQITLWRISDRTRQVSYPARQTAAAEAIPFAITRDASLAVYGSPTIHLLDLATGHQRWQARAADDFLMVAVFSPDGRTLATTAGYNEKSIRLWDVSSGKEINRLEGHGSFVYGLVFWPDGKTLASAGTDGTIRVWNLGQLTNVPPSRLVAINNCAEAPLALLPGNTTLVSGAIDGAVQIWDAGRPEPRISPVELPVRIGGAWRFTPDSQSVLTVAGGRVARWFGADFQQTEPVLDVGASFSALFSEDGQTLAVGSEDGTVRLWDLRPRKPLGQFKNPRPASPVKFLSNKQRLVVKDVEFGGALHEWDVATGRETRSWRRPTGFRPERSGNFAFSPDERWFLRVDEVGTGSLFDLVANREINPGFLMKGMYCAAFSRDGRFFAAVGSEVSKLKLWATEDVRELGTLDTSGHSLGFSPDNRRLAVGDLGKNAVAIWDVTGGHRLLASPP